MIDKVGWGECTLERMVGNVTIRRTFVGFRTDLSDGLWVEWKILSEKLLSEEKHVGKMLGI